MFCFKFLSHFKEEKMKEIVDLGGIIPQMKKSLEAHKTDPTIALMAFDVLSEVARQYLPEIGVDGVELVLDCIKRHKEDGNVEEKALTLLENLSENGMCPCFKLVVYSSVSFVFVTMDG